jgi:hypothetical protein
MDAIIEILQTYLFFGVGMKTKYRFIYSAA